MVSFLSFFACCPILRFLLATVNFGVYWLARACHSKQRINHLAVNLCTCQTWKLRQCRGCVTCLKLSPNLRKVSKPADDKQKVEDLEVSIVAACMGAYCMSCIEAQVESAALVWG